jgi:outer membrane immunogenic protein
MRNWIAGLAFALMGALLVMTMPAIAADKDGDRAGPAIAAPGLSFMPGTTTNSWSGAYVGLHGGYGIGVNELRVGEGEDTAFLRGLSADGFIGGVHLGADYHLQGTIWVLGIRGGYTWSDMEFQAGIGGETLSVGIKESWWVDGVVGLGLNSVKPYVFLGYTEAKTHISIPGLDTPDLQGWRAGLGIEWKIPGAQFVTLGLDYAYTRYDDVDLCGGCGAFRLEPEDHRVLLTMNLRFPPK